MRKPQTIRIIAAILVLWQALGIASYLSYVGLLGGGGSPDGEPPLPTIIHASYAIGVFAGAAGTLALALLRRLARPLLWLSLAALVIDWGWLFANSAAASVPLGVTVLAVAGLLAALTEAARRGGMLR